jgi:hypothetical protein
MPYVLSGLVFPPMENYQMKSQKYFKPPFHMQLYET